MRYSEFLPEAIANTNELVINALDVMPETIKKFVSDNTLDILKTKTISKISPLGQYKILQKYRPKLNSTNSNIQKNAVDNINALFNNISNELMAMLYDDDIIENLVYALELELQNVVKDYITKNYGKIEPISPSVDRNNLDYDQAYATNNLFWAEHLIVQLKTNEISKKTGKPQTGGGYFHAYPSKFEITSKTGQNINWNNDFVVLINIYIDKLDIWNIIINEILNEIEYDVYGSYQDLQLIENFIKKVIATFVHETVHFEQEIRAKEKTKTRRYYNKTMLPNTDLPREKVIDWYPKKNPRGSPNQGLKHTKYRAGRRGVYPDIFSSNNPKVWAAYLGRNIEIEAHAAHLAAEIYSDIVTDRFGYKDRKMPQEDINYYLDNRIQDIKSGVNKPNSYLAVIASRAKAAVSNPNMSNEDKRFIKVWNLFRKKLIQHLNSYKK